MLSFFLFNLFKSIINDKKKTDSDYNLYKSTKLTKRDKQEAKVVHRVKMDYE